MTTGTGIPLPLRGEWTALQTPAHRVPSHGTHFYAQTYAFDFVRLGHPPQPRPSTRQLFRDGSVLALCTRGIPLREFHGWGEPIHAPFDGTVIEARDGLAERDPVRLPRDVWIALRNARGTEQTFRADPQRLAGNYLILSSDAPGVHALFAHCQTGSLQVAPGARVRAGEPIARVGHSGNSTAPHLHFQLMDSADPFTARGLPCCFLDYEVWGPDGWRRVPRGIPRRGEVFRS